MNLNPMRLIRWIEQFPILVIALAVMVLLGAGLFVLTEIFERKTVVLATAPEKKCDARFKKDSMDLLLTCDSVVKTYPKGLLRRIGLNRHMLKHGQHTVLCLETYDISANLEIRLPYTEGHVCRVPPKEAQNGPGAMRPDPFFITGDIL